MVKPGLRWQIVFTLIFVMVTASFLIGLVVMSVTKKTIVNQKMDGAISLRNAFQNSINAIAYGDDDFYHNKEKNWQVQRLIKLFSLEKGVENILIVDLFGKVIASSDPLLIGTSLQDRNLKEVINAGPAYSELSQAKRILFKKTNKELSFFSPFYFKNQNIGAMRITLSLGEMQAVINKSYKLILAYIIFTATLVTFFGISLFSRLIVRPIKKLVKTTEAIGEGDYDPNKFETSRNEIGQLSFAFSRMAERINEHQGQLRAQIESLEKLNRKLQQSQKELIAEEKLALVGKLVAGVAHEIGNPLSAILGYVSLLQTQENANQDSADYLKRIEQELNRINKTIRELLDFSRLKKVEKTKVDIKQVIENSLSLLKHQRKFQNITLTKHIEKDLWLVEGDEHQLQQVFLNVLLNAGEALGEKGKLAVLADRVVWQGGSLRRVNSSMPENIFPGVPEFGFGEKEVYLNDVLFSENQALVRIIFADNGEGIEQENLNKIFDPFFTTREPGKGTGLGLAICNRILESFGGGILARSEVKKGSAFLVLLPAINPVRSLSLEESNPCETV
jgi:signal transduction histidine kinase